MNVAETIELSNYALNAGATKLMLITPWYFRLCQDAVFNYFDEIASHVKGDIYLYNFPFITGYNLDPATILKLAKKHPNIIGLKDTVTERINTRSVLTTVLPEVPNFEVLAGFDEHMYHIAVSGGVGCIGGLSNLYPEITTAYTKAVNDGDAEQIQYNQRKIDKLMEIYTLGSPFFPIIKEGMRLRGVEMTGVSTKPHLLPNETQVSKLKVIMEAVERM